MISFVDFFIVDIDELYPACLRRQGYRNEGVSLRKSVANSQPLSTDGDGRGSRCRSAVSIEVIGEKIAR